MNKTCIRLWTVKVSLLLKLGLNCSLFYFIIFLFSSQDNTKWNELANKNAWNHGARTGCTVTTGKCLSVLFVVAQIFIQLMLLTLLVALPLFFEIKFKFTFLCKRPSFSYVFMLMLFMCDGVKLALYWTHNTKSRMSLFILAKPGKLLLHNSAN